jgi:hypothetical protein
LGVGLFLKGTVGSVPARKEEQGVSGAADQVQISGDKVLAPQWGQEWDR